MIDAIAAIHVQVFAEEFFEVLDLLCGGLMIAVQRTSQYFFVYIFRSNRIVVRKSCMTQFILVCLVGRNTYIHNIR